MPFKSILRAVGRHFAAWPMSYRPGMFYPLTKAGPRKPLYPDLDRLTSRRDWNWPEAERAGFAAWNAANMSLQPVETDGPDMAPPSPLWPPQDDPYAKPEPCDVVPDLGLSALSKLSERGLTGELGSVQSVTDLITLIERQEAAEKHLQGLGMVWTRERGWHLPDPYLA